MNTHEIALTAFSLSSIHKLTQLNLQPFNMTKPNFEWTT